MQVFVGAMPLSLAASQLTRAVSSPLAGPMAAWMPPSSLHGCIHGLSRAARAPRNRPAPRLCTC
ncbi:hypothetical protein BVV10_07650 [Xanthomonas oryzae pv. oryzae]|nr:hypothetical protein BVV16_07625 [Xanthomonas oryzae pv. oryzae]AUI93768.1 hypothetical protein BVV17_07640 [Xanthomonas oryzae pv. oryzae]AUI97437.1 hypothetical protein BVV18_07645 [Xanthomonas oryzae pv. oryzae]AUJ01113.1 hypothetical protein BVV10_07650 [Xanthomonas oryzae pv. oryzae]AUJ04787.1 hypothetical protein BVV19_07655 [Xanthomonas oryzae pv. oryzae]